MGKSTKKKTSAANTNFSQKQLRNHAEKTLRETCEKLTGPDTIKHFSKHCLPLITDNRYDSVKLRKTANCYIHETDFNLLNKHFKRILGEENFTTAIGENIPLSNYLKDGLSLIHFVFSAEENGLTLNPALLQAFQPYHRDGDLYLIAIKQIATIINNISLLMNDWREFIFLHDLKPLCVLSGTSSNEILISTTKPEITHKRIDGHNRQLIRAGSSDLEGEIEWYSIRPEQIGYYNQPDSKTPVPIYIQQHALQRIHQRIGLLPGLIQESIKDTFELEKIKWHKSSEKRLVEFKIQRKKIGYLVCSYNEGTIIIRSFLFLTNSGTPEGNKLSQLTSLEALDKQYLGIDNLLGFAGFDFKSEPRLAELFTQAGCADLLDLEHLCRITRNNIVSQNIEHLLQYLTKTEQSINQEEESETETTDMETI